MRIGDSCSSLGIVVLIASCSHLKIVQTFPFRSLSAFLFFYFLEYPFCPFLPFPILFKSPLLPPTLPAPLPAPRSSRGPEFFLYQPGSLTMPCVASS